MPKSVLRLMGTICLVGSIIIGFYQHFELNSKLVIGGALSGSTVLGDSFPKTLIDPIGISHLLTAPAQRIVSTTLAGDEMLQQLDALEALISVTYFVDDPKTSNIPGYYPPSIYRNYAEIEEILSLTPDLVIVAPYTNATTVHLLLANNIPIIRFSKFNSFEDIDTNLHLLAQVTDKNTQAEMVLKDMWQRIKRTKCLTQSFVQPRVLFYTLGGTTAGRNTLMDDMIHYAGGINAAREADITGFANITSEYAVSLRPDILIVTHWFAESNNEALAKLQDNPLWENVPAVANKQVYVLDGKSLNTVTPFRALGVEKLAQILHPALQPTLQAALHQSNNDIHCGQSPQ